MATGKITCPTNLKTIFLLRQTYLDNQSLAANTSASYYLNSPTVSGFTPRIVLTCEITNASSSGTQCSYAGIWKCHHDSNSHQIGVSIRNYSNANAKIKITVKILYERNVS